jgi:hypothetical protein
MSVPGGAERLKGPIVSMLFALTMVVARRARRTWVSGMGDIVRSGRRGVREFIVRMVAHLQATLAVFGFPPGRKSEISCK